MSEINIKRALIAVYDKTGIAEFARALVDEFGIEILSTGGTAKHLKDAGIPVTMVEQVTGMPEMLDGRVKTLHPHIHAGILADRDKPDHMRQLAEHGILPIDMVVVNLYPFEQTIAKPGCTFEEAIEMIDIGGPCMLRAAAKNHKHVVVVPSTELGTLVLKDMRERAGISEMTRVLSASQAFALTMGYDATIGRFLSTHAMEAVQRVIEAESGSNQNSEPYEKLGAGPDPHHFELQQESGSLILDWRVPLRYGENPAQNAAVYMLSHMPADECRLIDYTDDDNPDVGRKQVAGPEMSFNNYVDGDSALSLVKELSRAALGSNYKWVHRGQADWEQTGRVDTKDRQDACPTQEQNDRLEAGPTPIKALFAVAFIKHTNACGMAIGDDPVDAYRRAYLGDPVAAAGGVLCVNFPVTLAFAEVVMNSFGSWGKAAGAAFFKLDVWIAPSFDEDAVQLITTPTEKRKWGASCRLLAVGPMDSPPDASEMDYKKITGGMLVQTRDLVGLNEDQWKVVSKRPPTEKEMADLRFAWLVCKHTKSNAITIVRDGMLLGNGAGQMSRVKSCDLAIQLARENGHGDKLAGAVAAGDAFFPVEDGPGKLLAAGITAIIHPGGSNRDADSIRVCDEAGAAMIMTGTRHFKH